MRALIPLFAATILAWSPSTVVADTALLIANSRYDDAQDLRDAGEIAALEAPLRDAGFDVIVVTDAVVASMREAISELLEAEEDERILIAAAGHVVRARDGAWLLGRDADRPDLGSVGAQGVALSVLMEVVSATRGRAVLLLGTESRRIALGRGLAPGLGPIDAPQGVTVLTGSPGDLAEFTERVLLQPGADLRAAVAATDAVQGHGFLTSYLPFLAAEDDRAEGPTGPSEAEIALWQAVRQLNTAGSYRAYINQYPQGAFITDARALLAALDAQEADPRAEAEAAETALGLSRGDRQDIQRELNLLGYNTRGIDGIFGPGSRTAIRNWQSANGHEATGFLTLAQIRAIQQQAARRAAELEEEERRQQEAEERADRAYWQATGQGQTEDGLRRYLERFPNGLFADVAEARLEEIEDDRRAEAEAQERADWDVARERDTVGSYSRYLDMYPRGLFVDSARARIAELEGGPSGWPGDNPAAEAQEAALNLPPITRVLIERRLAAMGLEPGNVDGQFDRRTRDAIARYQGQRGLDVTGYLNQTTVVRLLAEAIGGSILD